jgi:site-specific DNA recombinase
VVVSEEMPLRGVLKCECGKMLTGAPSRGKLGKYYYYYKCDKTRHLNLSAIKAHDQLRQVFSFMSLPDKDIKLINKNADQIFEHKMLEDKRLLTEKKKELESEDAKLFSIEEKWITNKITQDTYERWFSTINCNRISLKGAIDRLNGNQEKIYQSIKNNVDKLADLEFIFVKSSVFDKQELVRLVFERNLYYHGGMYRTPTMIELLSHNALKMRELWL